MKRIILFDTSIATENKGDEVIMESVMREMKPVLDGNFVYHFPTHTVAFPMGHQFTSTKAKMCQDVDYKFICGTNLFWTNMLHPNPLLNVNLMNYKPFKNSVLLGVGYDEEQCKGNFDPYSKKLWRNILSSDYVHSVRDDQTVEYLDDLGFKAINTGCPTLWKLTSEHCKQIPTGKADKVVFTLSATGGIHKENDQALIDMLLRNYKEVYFYSQTYDGYRTLQTYHQCEKIKIVEPDLVKYRHFLEENDVDYVGTRLHGGVYAMQQKCRSIILSVDNRAREFDKYHINCMDQFDIKGIEEKINSDFETKVDIDYRNVEKWIRQFV